MGSGSTGYNRQNNPLDSEIGAVSSMSFDAAGHLIFTDQYEEILALDLDTPTLSILAGKQNSTRNSAGNDGKAVDAEFYSIEGVAVDSDGKIFVIDRDFSPTPSQVKVRVIDTDTDRTIREFKDISSINYDTPRSFVISEDNQLYIGYYYEIYELNTDAKLSGTPQSTLNVGSHTVQLRADDGNGGITTQDFSIEVVDPTSSEVNIEISDWNDLINLPNTLAANPPATGGAMVTAKLMNDLCQPLRDIQWQA